MHTRRIAQPLQAVQHVERKTASRNEALYFRYTRYAGKAELRGVKQSLRSGDCNLDPLPHRVGFAQFKLSAPELGEILSASYFWTPCMLCTTPTHPAIRLAEWPPGPQVVIVQGVDSMLLSIGSRPRYPLYHPFPHRSPACHTTRRCWLSCVTRDSRHV
jgi:hypothetical protein